MKLGTAIAEIMKREGIEILCGYPVNHLIEHAANADIRPVMVRQERIGLHMADAISRVTSGRTIGAFCMQHGPGAENAMGGVAQCYGESVPVLVLPMGYARRLANIEPNFNSSQAMKAFAKSAEPINIAAEVGNIFRRAFTKLKNGRGGPVIVEIPADMWNEEVPEPLNYTPVLRTRYGADPLHVKEAAALLIGATTNRWTMEFQPKWRFQFVRNAEMKVVIEDRQEAGKQWTISAKDDGSSPDDYILICRIRNSVTGGLLLVGGGLKQFGTEAAGHLLADPDQLGTILRKLPRGWETKNVQIVLHAQVIGNTPAQPEVVASHVW